MKGRAALPALTLVVASVAAAGAVAQSPVFRAESNYVEVTARVADRTGRLVDGLTREDFTIREDHRPQRVETAFKVRLPTPWTPAPADHTVLYRPGLPPTLHVATGRIYLLYLNAVEAQHIALTRRLTREFVDTFLLPDDVVALWDDRAGLVTFTNDKARLHAAIGRFLGTDEGMTAPVTGTADLGRVDPGLGTALDWFDSVQGRRKSVLLFSAGWAGLGPVFADGRPSLSRQTQLVDRSDIQIYVVDTRGLVPPMGVHRSATSASGTAAADALTAELRAHSQGIDDMRWLAEDTGGFAIVNHNTYVEGFRRIVEENSEYYVLGYQSTAPRGKSWDYREISVKVTKPGLDDLTVRARRGYIAR